MLNNMDAEVWAYLSLVCLKTGRQVEAEQSFKFAIKVIYKLFNSNMNNQSQIDINYYNDINI